MSYRLRMLTFLVNWGNPEKIKNHNTTIILNIIEVKLNISSKNLYFQKNNTFLNNDRLCQMYNYIIL